MGEAEVGLFNPFRAIDLCNLSIKNYCNLLTSFAVDRSLYNVRKTFLERLSDYFDADEDPAEVIQVFKMIKQSSRCKERKGDGIWSIM